MRANKIRAVLIDLSGTLHIENELIPGAAQAVAKLQQQQPSLLVRFVSNTTKESRQTLLSRLQKLGLDIQRDHLYTSLSAAALEVQRQKLNPFFILSNDAQTEFDQQQPTSVNPEFDSVVVGLSPENFVYPKLNEAFRILMNNKDSKLIAVHKGRYYATKDGLSLNCGPFVAALEYATGKEATVIGKPSKAFFERVLSDLHVSAEESIMIGDDIKDDVVGAQNAGLKGILVRTGKYTPQDEHIPNVKPDHVANDIQDAVDWIIKFNS